MMEVLFHVATPDGARILIPLARACSRARRRYACFFTHDGVLGLRHRELLLAAADAVRLVACEESWRKFCADIACPVELGSQTVNSALIGDAARVVSL
jgi:hypothetical protein